MEISNVYNPSSRFNRIVYVGLIIAGILHILLKHNVSDAVFYFAIALCFDPFDQQVKWEDRSLYQKFWLGVHVLLVLILVVWFIF